MNRQEYSFISSNVFYLMRNLVLQFYIILAAAKDHVKVNVRRMREIQAKCKQRQEEQSTLPVKPLYKPDKYDHIPSKVTMYVKVS